MNYAFLALVIVPNKVGSDGQNTFVGTRFTAGNLFELRSSKLVWCFELWNHHIYQITSSHLISFAIFLKSFVQLGKKWGLIHHNQIINHLQIAWCNCCQTAELHPSRCCFQFKSHRKSVFPNFKSSCNSMEHLTVILQEQVESMIMSQVHVLDLFIKSFVQ